MKRFTRCIACALLSAAMAGCVGSTCSLGQTEPCKFYPAPPTSWGMK